MDTQSFYELFAAMCFTMLGLWWNVAEKRSDWRTDARTRSLSSGIYLSFLIPGAMGLIAAAGGESSLIWRVTFLLAGVLGIYYTLGILRRTAGAAGSFHRGRWAVIVLYSLIILFSIFNGLPGLIGLHPLQMEAILLALLALLGHGLAWELVMSAPPGS